MTLSHDNVSVLKSGKMKRHPKNDAVQYTFRTRTVRFCVTLRPSA